MRTRTLFKSFLVLAGAGAAAGWLITSPAKLSDADLAELASATADPARGETVFWAAGCGSCHAEENASGDAKLVLAGGQRFASGFGTFIAPNISPDPTHGLGSWNLNEFARALTLGVSPEGAHYYPAFPYGAYAKMEMTDVADLWAFFQTLPSDATPSEPHDIGFPVTIRRGLGLWKLRYLSDDFMKPPAQTADGERGRYLVEALAHCSECHTPRDIAGGLMENHWMAGAPSPDGKGRIPAIVAPAFEWSTEDIAYYLETGFTPEFDSSGGHMASVIENMGKLTPEDRLAIANYISSLPPDAP